MNLCLHLSESLFTLSDGVYTGLPGSQLVTLTTRSHRYLSGLVTYVARWLRCKKATSLTHSRRQIRVTWPFVTWGVFQYKRKGCRSKFLLRPNYEYSFLIFLLVSLISVVGLEAPLSVFIYIHRSLISFDPLAKFHSFENGRFFH